MRKAFVIVAVAASAVARNPVHPAFLRFPGGNCREGGTFPPYSITILEMKATNAR